jgi:(p)ppGpp synthase/HD superfamily hydrolase
MHSVVDRARAFARVAHAEQTRKYTGEPYVVHTDEVAALVAGHGGTPEMIAAAHLHDVLEDTPTTFDTLAAEFGRDIAELVAALSDQVPKPAGNRKLRKQLESDRLGTCEDRVHTIKLADIVSNTRSIAERDPRFARVYLVEMRYLVDRLTRGDQRLWAEADAIVEGQLPTKSP